MAHIVELHPGDVLVVRTDVVNDLDEGPEFFEEVMHVLDLVGVIFLDRGIDLEALNDPNLRALGLQRIPTQEKSDG